MTVSGAETSGAENTQARAQSAVWRLRVVAHRHWAFIVLVMAGLALRVAAQLADQPAILYIDSAKYLAGASQADPVGYRLVLVPLERLGGLGLVAAAQHLAGLGIAAGLYALLLHRGLPRWLAVLAAAPVLLDAYQVQIEQMIVPDLMFETLIAAGIIILAWDSRPRLRLLVAGALPLGAAVDVRQIGEILLVPLLLFALLSARGLLRRGAHTVVAGVAFCLPVLAYMGVNAQATGNFAVTANSPDVLYGRTAYAANCATLVLPAYERPLCPSQSLIATIGGIDGIMHDWRSPIHNFTPPPGITTSQAETDFSHRVLHQQPMKVAASAARDAARLFAITRDGDDTAEPPIGRWQFQSTQPMYYDGPVITSLISRYASGHAQVNHQLARTLRAYQLNGGYTPGPLYLLALLIAVAGFILGWRRDRPLAITCLLLTTVAATVIGGADFYEFSWRYQIPALVTILPAGAIGSALAARRVHSDRERLRTAFTSVRTTLRLAPQGSEP